MPILSGDVKMLKSAVMADVPEGGGAPTANAIADGVSNAIFPDISELDRAGGRVNLRKTFVSIQTDDTDTYFGGNVIVAEPPQDPRVSVTLFSTGGTFDQRTSAATRIESYLNTGGEWPGFLFENHITGQRVIQIFQRPEAELPTAGETITLVENEGEPTAKIQYIRATSVSSVTRQFYDPASGADFTAAVVTVEISDALRYDFTGSPASRSFARTETGTKIRETVVADAGVYAGVVPLTATADLGDFSVSGSSIFTQLVPSAQTETPISDVKTNGLSAHLVATGGPVTQSLTLAFTPTQAMFVGGPIYPGTLEIARAGVALTDSAGLLMNAGVQVGLVDYAGGIATLTADVFGAGGGTHAVTFTPATVPDMISEQSAIRVTATSQAQSYAFTLGSLPLPGSLSISYLAQGRWYVLRDNSAGVLKGGDAAYGTGTVNYTTGSIVVTLGALPDVGGALVISHFSQISTIAASNTTLANAGKAYAPMNTSWQASEEPGNKSIALNGLAVSWSDGGAKLAVDDGLGGITGDATGTVDYANGVIRLSPNTLPPPGTVFVVDINGNTGVVASNVPLANGSIGATNIIPGSVSFTASLVVAYTWDAWGSSFPAGSYTDNYFGAASIYDRNGGLFVRYYGNEFQVGTINYATGQINVTGATPSAGVFTAGAPAIRSARYSDSGGFVFTSSISWGQFVGSKSVAISFSSPTAEVKYGSTAPGADSGSVTVSQYAIRSLTVPNYTLRGVSFELGGVRYTQLTDGTLVHSASPTTGGGTPAGSVSGALGAVFLSYWPAGADPQVANWRGVIAPPTVGTASPFTSFQSIFRVAASPLRPASLSVLGTMQDGTTFNVTAGVDGKINGTRVKGRVDYEYGLVELFFVNPTGNTALNVDLSFLGIAGLATIPADLVQLNTLRYNAVAYSYLPLDADLLGIDPVRLPSDGRVPIFRPGGFAVVGHTGEITATVTNAQTINCARVRLSRVRVIGADGVVINTGYTNDLDAGTVTFTDVSGYSQPVTVQHRIEDMAVVGQVDINGTITFTRPLTHDYPLGSYVSSALIAGDLFSRVSHLFDQETWTGVWQDTAVGAAATGTYNATQYPVVVTNRGALTERWSVVFNNTTSFSVSGENVGVIADGNTGAACAPMNPATGVPYFSIPAEGWGSGWSVGNVLRFNTVAASFPVWVVRTVQQGPETVPDDSFTLLIRGDVDTP
jgi:hypothetical protein